MYTIENIKQSEHMKKYLSNVEKAFFKVKVPHYQEDSNFKQKYCSSIQYIPKKYLNTLKIYLKNIITKFKKLKLEFIIKDPFYILCSIHNLENNMPFTIDKAIIVPKKRLLEIHRKMNSQEYDYDFEDMLIHEKIHNFQRKYQNIFNANYPHFYPFLAKKIRISKLPPLLKLKNMTNPDSNDHIWLYKTNMGLIYPILEKKKDYFENIGYTTNFTKKIQLHDILPFSRNVSVYHPNEILACEVAHDVFHLNYNSKNINFIKSMFT